MSYHQPIVVTGIGVVSPFGLGYPALLDGLASERSCVAPVEAYDLSRCRARNSAYFNGFNPSAFDDSTHFSRLARGTQFSIIATDEAVRDAQLSREAAARGEVGLLFASTRVALEKTQQFYLKILEKGPRRVNPLVFQETVNNAPASHICLRYGIIGPSLTITSGATGGVQALSIAAHWLRSGKVGSVVVTAADVVDAPSQEAHGHARGHAPVAIDGVDEVCPFDPRRNGYVLGEAAVCFVLELGDGAKQRGARPRVELSGWGVAHDDCGPGRYHAEGLSMESAMRQALLMAEASPSDIGWVLASAQSSKQGDRAEARALRRVFPAQVPPVSALKSVVGEVESASAPLFIAAAVAGIRDGVLYPTLNHKEHDPDCRLDLVTTRRDKRVDAALVNALWFGGGSASVVVRRPNGTAQDPSSRAHAGGVCHGD